jgi:hypothetical protein
VNGNNAASAGDRGQTPIYDDNDSLAVSDDSEGLAEDRLQAKNILWQRFRSDPNVIGIGLGSRRKKGKDTGVPAVVVGVLKKRPKSGLHPDSVIPKTMRVGDHLVEIDVIRMPPARAGPLRSR